MAETRKGPTFNPWRDAQAFAAVQLQALEMARRQKVGELLAQARALQAASRARPLIDPRLNQEVRAGLSGAADGAFMGLADPVSAGARALVGRGGNGGIVQRFKNNLAAEQAQDSYDRENYGGARLAGQAAGTVASLAATGGALGGVNAARAGLAAVSAGRLVPRVSHVLRLTGAAGAAGGAGNVASQVAVDAITGQKTTLGDFAGSLTGGVIGGVAAPFLGAGRGAALGGVATPLIQGALNGEAPSFVDVALGAGGGLLAGKRSQAEIDKILGSMKSWQKGELGESLSRWDSRLQGRRVLATQVNKPVSGGKTVADHITDKTIDEAKFGPRARLSVRQKEALAELPNYVVSHYLPKDLHAVAAVMLTGLGAPIIQVADDWKLKAGAEGPDLERNLR